MHVAVDSPWSPHHHQRCYCCLAQITQITWSGPKEVPNSSYCFSTDVLSMSPPSIQIPKEKKSARSGHGLENGSDFGPAAAVPPESISTDSPELVHLGWYHTNLGRPHWRGISIEIPWKPSRDSDWQNLEVRSSPDTQGIGQYASQDLAVLPAPALNAWVGGQCTEEKQLFGVLVHALWDAKDIRHQMKPEGLTWVTWTSPRGMYCYVLVIPVIPWPKHEVLGGWVLNLFLLPSWEKFNIRDRGWYILATKEPGNGGTIGFEHAQTEAQPIPATFESQFRQLASEIIWKQKKWFLCA